MVLRNGLGLNRDQQTWVSRELFRPWIRRLRSLILTPRSILGALSLELPYLHCHPSGSCSNFCRKLRHSKAKRTGLTYFGGTQETIRQLLRPK